MISDKLQKAVSEALKTEGIKRPQVTIEHPTDWQLGDYATNAAMVYGKKLDLSPLDLARRLVAKIKQANLPEIEKIEIAGFGFINFFLTRQWLADQVKQRLKPAKSKGRPIRVMVEYTDPNPFKELHIGHLMNNTIGEAIAGIYQAAGAQTVRVCYQGDIGLHVAKAIYGLREHLSQFWWQYFFGTLSSRAKALGQAYQLGHQDYESKLEAKSVIDKINRALYQGSNWWLKFLYRTGRQWSLNYFAVQYRQLGTKFDYFFFESQTGQFGVEVVKQNLTKGIFKSSQGAIIFPGEKYGLHNRVFINSAGLPTYEAKDLGLAKIKFATWPYDRSIIVTNREVEEYFKVVLKALEQIWPDLASQTVHIPHGTLRLATGKMSSRAGTIITAEQLLADVTEQIMTKMADRPWSRTYRQSIANIVAVAAIKYTVLRQAPGRDIVFDYDKSLSLEGDSGPYLLYTLVRAKSVLAKSSLTEDQLIQAKPQKAIFEPERLLYRWDEVLQRAKTEQAPHHLVGWLTDLASAFNVFYAQHKIIDPADPESVYKVLLTKSLAYTLERGLRILGFKIPAQM